MKRWIWLNGETIPMYAARLSVEDRGYQFADGVYEVVRIYRGHPFTLDEHLARLERSAAGIKLALPLDVHALGREIHRFLIKSGLNEGMLYLQLTRGTAPRDHIFPEVRPNLLFYTRVLPPAPLPGEGEGVKLKSLPDERWRRCWIKSIALLPNVLAKNEAVADGYDEAAFVENGIVTECSASNLFVVIHGKLVTHPVGSKVLPGITRMVLIQEAGKLGIDVDERPIQEEEVMRADELFITSTTREVNWVARWNDRYIGQGRCGGLTKRLHEALVQRIVAETR